MQPYSEPTQVLIIIPYVQILAQEQTDSFQEVRTFKYYNKEFNNYE